MSTNRNAWLALGALVGLLAGILGPDPLHIGQTAVSVALGALLGLGARRLVLARRR